VKGTIHHQLRKRRKRKLTIITIPKHDPGK